MIILIVTVILVLSLLINIFLLISLRRAFDQIDILEDWIIEFQKQLDITYNKLKEVDNRGIFEKDDDVGFLFSDILNIIINLNKRLSVDTKNYEGKSTDSNEKN